MFASSQGTDLSCQFQSAFNTLGSASLYSQLCGVLAALTFSALVGGLASRVQNHRGLGGSGSRRSRESFNDPQDYRALLLAFVVLLFSSALWGLVYGAADSARSRLMVIAAVWMTVLGTLLMLVALISFIGEAWPSAITVTKMGDKVENPRRTAVTIFRLVALFGAVVVWVATTDALGVWGGVSWYSSWQSMGAVIFLALVGIFVSSSKPFQALKLKFDTVLNLSIGCATALTMGFGYLASINGMKSIFLQVFCQGGVPHWWIVLLSLPTLSMIVITTSFGRFFGE